MGEDLSKTRSAIESPEDIRKLVYAFYDKVAEDKVIGPHFTEIAHVDWDQHLPKMVEFWSFVLLHQGSYSGNTTRVHVEINEKKPITGEHFDHWLKLWAQTVDDHFVGEIAETAKEKARFLALVMGAKINSN